jgi:hypothetical protein
MIDGRYILGKPSAKLIMRPGETVDLERFIDKMDEGDAFKFVSALAGAGVQDPTSGENGRVQIIFEPEKMPVVTTSTFHGVVYTTAAPGGWGGGGGILRSMSVGARGSSMGGGSGGVGGLSSLEASMNTSNAGMGGGGGVVNSCYHVGAMGGGANTASASMGANTASASMGAATLTSSNSALIPDFAADAIPTDLGATVHGSKSFQKFENSQEWFLTSAPVTLDIWMRGHVEMSVSKVFTLNLRASPPRFDGPGISLCEVAYTITRDQVIIATPSVRLDYHPSQVNIIS